MNIIFMLLISIPCILIAFTVHEFAHGYSAWKLGDPTAKYEGRLTLDPRPHIDPFGAIVLLLSLLTSGGRFVVGWAKPVPINYGRLRNPRRDGTIIAASGALANFTLAAIVGLFFRTGILPMDTGNILSAICYYLVMINIGLGIFNLLPIPPLDGWKVLQGFMPSDIAYNMMKMEYANPMFTWIILAIFILSPLPDYLLGIPFRFLINLFISPF